ncbi:hypothetical protein ACIA5A_19360 [Micromonospora sp. NPDC051300]
MSQHTRTETTRLMPRGGVALRLLGRAGGRCATEQNWKPGWRRE